MRLLSLSLVAALFVSCSAQAEEKKFLTKFEATVTGFLKGNLQKVIQTNDGATTDVLTGHQHHRGRGAQAQHHPEHHVQFVSSFNFVFSARVLV